MVSVSNHEPARTDHTRWQFVGSSFDRLRMSECTITVAERIRPWGAICRVQENRDSIDPEFAVEHRHGQDPQPRGDP